MSAYMVANETINRVVYWLYFEVAKSQWLREKLEKTSGVDTSAYEWTQTLGKAVFQLNIDGVNARYGDGEAKQFRALDYRYKPAHSSAIQVLKSLQCWLYQCMEGEVVKQPLYIFFNTVVEPHLMSSIISNLPEYNKAVWG
jgi:hypothetical protein